MATLFRRRSLFGGLGVALGIQLLPRLHLDADANVVDVVDPDSGISFPGQVRVPGQFKNGPLQLVGVGVRTVSFLGLQVYSIGFYADLAAPALKLRADMSADEKIEHIIDNTAVMLRIIPTRSTSYSHLRDAFLRMLQTRQNEAKKRGEFTEEDALAVGAPIRTLKTMLPNTPFVKGSFLDVFMPAPVSGQPRTLILRDMGALQNSWVATNLFLHYFSAKPASPALKKRVVEKLSG